MIFMRRLFIASATMALIVGCAASPAYWAKEGSSARDTSSAESKCEYQVRLQKTAAKDVESLKSLCMKGEGYRLKRG